MYTDFKLLTTEHDTINKPKGVHSEPRYIYMCCLMLLHTNIDPDSSINLWNFNIYQVDDSNNHSDISALYIICCLLELYNRGVQTTAWGPNAARGPFWIGPQQILKV